MSGDHPTEAACLLEQGKLYRRRIGLKPLTATEDPIFAGFKLGAFSVYFGDAPIYHFDLEGRWQRAFVENIHYLKGLDAEIHAIERVREGPSLVLQRRTLSVGEAAELDERVRTTACNLTARLNSGSLAFIQPVSPSAQSMTRAELLGFLDRIGSWTAAAWRLHRERHQRTYSQLPFLPPECQNAIVLQATLGHGSGHGTGHQTSCRSIPEFGRHVDEVKALWGQRLLQSRILFLAGPEVLHQPTEKLIAFLKIIGEAFPIEPKIRGGTRDRFGEEEKLRFDGVHAMIGDFFSPLPDRSGWRELAQRGLTRITLDVISGDPKVRSVYQKSWTEDSLETTISDIKAAGLGISILLLVGAGGVEFAATHVGQTVRLIESLELTAGDFVFLLDEREIDGQNLFHPGVTSQSGAAWSEQQARFKDALASFKKKGLKVLPYTLEKQWT
jgi:hypothetical protein